MQLSVQENQEAVSLAQTRPLQSGLGIQQEPGLSASNSGKGWICFILRKCGFSAFIEFVRFVYEAETEDVASVDIDWVHV